MEAFTKQPWEEILKGFDLTKLLEGGVTISSCEVIPTTFPQREAAPSVIASTIATLYLSDKAAAVKVQGGEDGQDYLITMRYLLSDGTKRETEMLMRVRDVPN